MTSGKTGWAHLSEGRWAGWAVTSDGGQSWQAVSLPRRCDNVVARSGQVAWAMGSRQLRRAVHSRTTICHTVDAGRHWRQTATITTFGDGVRQLAFVDHRHGWLVTAESVGMHAAAAPYELYRTSDAGRHWTPVAAADAGTAEAFPISSFGGLPDARGAHLNFIDDTTGWLVGETGIAEAGAAKGVFTETRDGGDSWHDVTLDGVVSRGVEQPPMFNGTHGIILVTVARGRDRRVLAFATADAGATWQRAAPVPTSRRVDYLDEAHAGNAMFVLTGPHHHVGLYRTTNDAGDWATVPNNLSGYFAGAQLEFVTRRVGFLLRHATILRTTDGGHTWTPRTNIRLHR